MGGSFYSNPFSQNEKSRLKLGGLFIYPGLFIKRSCVISQKKDNQVAYATSKHGVILMTVHRKRNQYWYHILVLAIMKLGNITVLVQN